MNWSQNIERHHLLPISLGWADKKYNIIELKSTVHSELHKTLDLAPHIYSKLVRKAREKTNHRIVYAPDDIEVWANMQRMFFDRFRHLALYLQHEHIKNMMLQYDHHTDLYKTITWDEFDKPKREKDLKNQFDEVYEKKILCEKEISKVILECIKKNIKLS